MRTVHLLNWNLTDIKSILPQIKQQGFDSIQIGPVQPFKEQKDFDWWLVYQPLGFSIGNMFGSKQDLTELCNEANKLGISIIVDVICNHMANKNGKEPLLPHKKVDKLLLERKDFWKLPIQLQKGDNRYCATHHCIGLPGLNLRNQDLQTIIFKFLNELKDCGVKGFRFDAAKHIGLPLDGIDFFKKVGTFVKENNLIAYGEFLGGNLGWRDEFTDYIPLLSNYNNTVTDLNKFVAFFESHDTFLNNDGYTKKFSTNDIISFYSLLTRSFKNTLFYVRPNTYPYNPESSNISFDSLFKTNSLNLFEDDFLSNDFIKYCNENLSPEISKIKIR